MERMKYLDWMKGIAIFFMVVGHVLLFSFNLTSCSLSKLFGLFDMPLFFYVSGYLCFRGISSFKDLIDRLIKRCGRLIFPWLAITILSCFYFNKSFLPCCLEFYWFFYVLFVLNTLFILLDYLVFRHILNPYLYSFCLLLIPVIFGSSKLLMGTVKFFPATQLTTYSCAFCFGWLCRKFPKLNNSILYNPIVFVLGLAFYVYGCWHYDSLSVFLRIAGGIGGIIVLQSFFKRIEDDGRNSFVCHALSIMGQSTLCIYMFNNYFIPDFTNLVSESILVVPNGLLWEFFLSAIIAIPIIFACILIRYICIRNPYLKYLVS